MFSVQITKFSFAVGTLFNLFNLCQCNESRTVLRCNDEILFFTTSYKTDDLKSLRELNWIASLPAALAKDTSMFSAAEICKCFWVLGLCMVFWLVYRVQNYSVNSRRAFKLFMLTVPFWGKLLEVVGLQLASLKIHYELDEIIKNKSNTFGSLVLVSWMYFCKSQYKLMSWKHLSLVLKAKLPMSPWKEVWSVLRGRFVTVQLLLKVHSICNAETKDGFKNRNVWALTLFIWGATIPVIAQGDLFDCSLNVLKNL